MSLSILKDLGMGKSVVETRINEELEQLVNSILKLNGHSFNPHNLVLRCINGILMGFIFGRHLDFDTDPLVRQTNDLIDSVDAAYGPDAQFFRYFDCCPAMRNASGGQCLRTGER
jgi:hypothetical protein